MIKKLLSLSAMVALISANSIAQTNMGFETWGPTTTSTSNPTGWETFNLGNYGGPTSTTAETASPGAGAKSAKLITTTGYAALLGVGNDTIPGMVSLGGDLLNGKALGGVPYTLKPSSIDLLFKSTPTGGDSCLFVAQLKHFDAASGTNIIDGQAYLIVNTTVSSWTSYNAVFNYVTSSTPDTLVMYALSSFSGNGSVAHPGSTFWIDGLVINGATGIQQTALSGNKIAVYPNPASSSIRIALNDNEATSINITDITGKVVKTKNVTSNVVSIDVENLPVGLYIYQVMNNNNVVYSSKFNVAR